MIWRRIERDAFVSAPTLLNCSGDGGSPVRRCAGKATIACCSGQAAGCSAARRNPLTVGACISGSHFGDIFSPISDAMILPSEACGVSPADTSRVLAPYRLIQLVICAILYLIFGIIMA